jgi:hypothetical protein
LKREDYKKIVETEDFLFRDPYQTEMMEEVGGDKGGR